MRFHVGILLVLALVACHGKSKSQGFRISEIDMAPVDEEFVIPASLWKTFEDTYPDLTQIAPPPSEKGEKEEKKEEKRKPVAKNEEEDEMFKRRPLVDPLFFSVFLTEKTSGVLDQPAYELKFGHGGGALDFKDYVLESKKGTFFMKIKYGEEMDHKLTKVFYLSNAKSGSGCNKYFEITKYWGQLMSGDGFMLNNSGLRHINATAGTFFFISPFKGKLRMGHLTLKDSRHPELLCKADGRN